MDGAQPRLGGSMIYVLLCPSLSASREAVWMTRFRVNLPNFQATGRFAWRNHEGRVVATSIFTRRVLAWSRGSWVVSLSLSLSLFGCVSLFSRGPQKKRWGSLQNRQKGAPSRIDNALSLLSVLKTLQNRHAALRHTSCLGWMPQCGQMSRNYTRNGSHELLGRTYVGHQTARKMSGARIGSLDHGVGKKDNSLRYIQELRWTCACCSRQLFKLRGPG